ncbi:MAG: hypothetical protein ABIL62_14595 [Planctomycetota bacterium]
MNAATYASEWDLNSGKGRKDDKGLLIITGGAETEQVKGKAGLANRLLDLVVTASSVGSPGKGSRRPADDPYHRPPIKRNVPATTDDTRQNELFHAGSPKRHPHMCPRHI